MRSKATSRRKVFLAALATAALLPALAQAQTRSSEPEESKATDDGMTDIQVIGQRAITGTKTDAALTEIPQSISVVTSEQFTDRASVDFQDVFRYSAGVQTERNGLDTRGDFFAARGFQTVQYLDGLNRQPAFIYGGRLEIFTVERAEVLRGPSSTLYGAGGVGGLFNAITKRPQEQFGGEIGLVYGTQGRKEVRFDVTGPLAEGLSARLVALGRDGHLIHESQADDRALVMPAITIKPGPGTEITVIGLYQKDSLGTQTYVPISKTIAAVNAADRISSYTFIGEPGFNHMDATYLSGTLLVTHNFGEVATFNSRTRIFGADANYAEIYGLASYADPATRRRINRSYYRLLDKYDGIGTDNNLIFKFATGPLEHQLLFGLDYTYFHQDRREGFPAAPPLDLYNPVYGVGLTTPAFSNAFQTRNTNLGLYGQEQVRAFDRISLVVGIRHDKVTSETIRTSTTKLPDNKAWTWRAGIIADVVPGVSPYFNYAESFQPVFGTNFVGIPYVARPGRQYEAGVKVAPSRGSLITVSLFDIQETNYISRDPNNIQNFIQGGTVGSRGVEVEANLRLPADFSLNAAYSYTDAKWLEDTAAAGVASKVGYRVENLPQHQASLWVSKGFELTGDIGLKVGGGVRYGSDRIDSFQNFVTPSTTLADAMAEVNYRDWQLSINGSNIFNTVTYTNCSRNPAAAEGYCYLARQRTVLGTLRRTF